MRTAYLTAMLLGVEKEAIEIVSCTALAGTISNTTIAQIIFKMESVTWDSVAKYCMLKIK